MRMGDVLADIADATSGATIRPKKSDPSAMS